MRTRDWAPRHRNAAVGAATLLAVAAAAVTLNTFFDSAPEPVRPLPAALKLGWSVAPAGLIPSDSAVIAQAGADGTLVISSPRMRLSADLCPTPRLEASCRAAALRVTLAWRRHGDPAAYTRSTTVASRHDREAGRFEIAFDELAVHPAWKGRIKFLAWRIEAGREPVELRTVGAEHAGLADLLPMLWRQWWSFEPIDAVSINTIRAPHVLGYAPATLLVLACVFIISSYIGVVVMRRRSVRLGVVAVIVVVAWILNDARWITAQPRQLAQDRAIYGQEVSDSSATAAWPAEIAQMARAARETLPDGAIYAVAGGNLPTAAGDTRLRYLLSPGLIQVNVDPLQPRVPPERAQYVLVLSAQAAAFDPDGAWLFTQGLPPMRVEVVRRFKDGGSIARRVER